MNTISPHRSVARRLSRRAAIFVGDTFLTVLAVLGAVCVVLVALSFFFKVSIILFRTGSMSPTIPAGSAALVRQVPADSVRVGDIVTIDRPGQLSVSHRIVAVEGEGATRSFTLRGDANPANDPIPYTVSHVRITLFSVPGIAPVIVWLGSPFVVGSCTVAAAALVLWALWPSASRSGSSPSSRDRSPRPPRSPRGSRREGSRRAPRRDQIAPGHS